MAGWLSFSQFLLTCQVVVFMKIKYLLFLILLNIAFMMPASA